MCVLQLSELPELFKLCEIPGSPKLPWFPEFYKLSLPFSEEIFQFRGYNCTTVIFPFFFLYRDAYTYTESCECKSE